MPDIIITRPEPRASEFASALRAASVNDAIRIAPLLKTHFLTPEIPAFECAIFTSKAAIEALTLLGIKAKGRGAFCVGAQTAKAARRAGFTLIHTALTAQNLQQYLQQYIAAAPMPLGQICHFCGAIYTPISVQNPLTGDDTPVQAVPIYAHRPLALTPEACCALASKSVSIIPVFSPHSAERLAFELRAIAFRDIILVAISKKADKAMRNLNVSERIILKRPTRTAMLQSIVKLVKIHA